jgi:hypothetical protein
MKYSGPVDDSHYGNTNTGESAVVFGEANSNTANRTLIIGKMNNNTGANSVISGYGNQTSSNQMIVGGWYNVEEDSPNSIISGEGNNIKHSAYVLVAGHNNSIDHATNAIVSGVYCAQQNDSYLIIGNGTSDTDRSNAFEVLKDGRAKLYSAPVEDIDIVRLKELNEKLNGAIDYDFFSSLY